MQNQDRPQTFATRQPRLFCVTKTSKYFGLALFIILPFIGGYVGYVSAPVGVVEVEQNKEFQSYSIDKNEVDCNPVWSIPCDVKEGNSQLIELTPMVGVDYNARGVHEKILSYVPNDTYVGIYGFNKVAYLRAVGDYLVFLADGHADPYLVLFSVTNNVWSSYYLGDSSNLFYLYDDGSTNSVNLKIFKFGQEENVVLHLGNLPNITERIATELPIVNYVNENIRVDESQRTSLAQSPVFIFETEKGNEMWKYDLKNDLFVLVESNELN